MRGLFTGLTLIAAGFASGGSAALAQTPRTPPPASASGNAKVAKLPWGDPDLQGIWPSTDMVGVPFERPAELAGRNEISEKEFAERQAQATRRAVADNEESVSAAAPTGDGAGSTDGPGCRPGPDRPPACFHLRSR